VCAASGDGIKESLWALIELISVSRSNGKAGTLWLSSSTNPRWKKVCLIFIEGLARANQHSSLHFTAMVRVEERRAALLQALKGRSVW
jgi:hypothetical protein